MCFTITTLPLTKVVAAIVILNLVRITFLTVAKQFATMYSGGPKSDPPPKKKNYWIHSSTKQMYANP